jgi:hypothetical protein
MTIVPPLKTCPGVRANSAIDGSFDADGRGCGSITRPVPPMNKRSPRSIPRCGTDARGWYCHIVIGFSPYRAFAFLLDHLFGAYAALAE